jgi:hypothetical protein
MDDTSPEIKAVMARMMASKTPGERLRMASNMFDTARKLVETGIRIERPHISEAQLRGQVFLRFYGQDFSKQEIEQIARAIPNMRLD